MNEPLPEADAKIMGMLSQNHIRRENAIIRVDEKQTIVQGESKLQTHTHTHELERNSSSRL